MTSPLHIEPVSNKAQGLRQQRQEEIFFLH